MKWMRKPDLGVLPLSIRLKLADRLLRRRAKTPLEMARYAQEQTEFFNRKYRGMEMELFEHLPLMLKTDVRDINPYDMLSKEHRDSVVYYGETTGSSGSPTPAFYTSDEFHAARKMAFISPILDEVRPHLNENRTCINGMAFGFTIAGMSFGDLMEAMGGLVLNSGSRSTLATPDRIARAIARLKPVAIAATPIDFLSWMRIVEEDHPEEYDEVRDSLKLLLSSAELVSEERVARISEAFGIRHVDVYACVEGLFTLPCTCGEKHILPIYHAEVFDESLKQPRQFGTGRLAFTNLMKESTPMVRYLLDDWVTIQPSHCPHGFQKSIVPHGRYELSVKVKGRNYGIREFENLLFQHGLFGDYQVVLEEGQITVMVEEYDVAQCMADEIAGSFRAEFEMKTVVSSVPFGSLTAYREPRKAKPILKVEDRRDWLSQEIPEFY